MICTSVVSSDIMVISASLSLCEAKALVWMEKCGVDGQRLNGYGLSRGAAESSLLCTWIPSHVLYMHTHMHTYEELRINPFYTQVETQMQL